MSASDDLMMLARVFGGLVVVVALMLLIARFARRSRMGGTHGLRVVERITLTRDAHIAVVEVDGRSLLLGVTAHGVTMLTGLNEPPRRQAPVHVVLETQAAGAPAPEEAPRRAARRAAEPPEPGAPARPATRATARESLEDNGMRLPPGLDLEGYSDLASALRAAGRTTRGPAEDEQPAPAPAAAPEPAARQSLPRRSDVRGGRARQARVPQQRQASGSPLSPSTWRQGIDALREYTVRKG